MTALAFYGLSDHGLARAWEDLADETGAPFYARHRWFVAWAKAFEAPVEVATVGVDAIDALAPVIRSRGRVKSAVNQETPDYAFVSRGPAERDRLIGQLLRVGTVEMAKLRSEDADAIKHTSGGRRIQMEVMQRSPFVDVSSDWSTYETTLRTKFRKDLKRRARRLAEEHEVAVELHEGAENLDTLLAEAFAVEALSWKAQQGTAISSRSETSTFYSDVARWAADNGWLKLWLLRVDGSAAAFALDLVADNSYFGLKVGYDPEHARYAPALLLQDDTVRYAFDQGLDRFEFLGADEPYKLNWAKECRDRLSVRVFSRGPMGRALWFGHTVVRPAIKRAQERRSESRDA